MGNQNDRYPDAWQVFVRSDGAEITCRPRRLARSESVSYRHVVLAEGERLDILAQRTLGSADQLWRLCEAGGILDPFEVRFGQSLRVPEV